ncbi:HAUS augmin-like complex subunit 6 isoform X2 [Peromyscus californicus insignis]|uniref:HAUS augmin-like complex subunit 6 isoform X2 n=1 Tax=Peromyscus californicus insignis TaxID=564181 RepID=UPI0022A744D8|nr:HAUS augmin-like complex subunit 6 isoform X2 [Peromyscus californicus insignis]
MSSAWDADFEKQHLWMYLQALGLDPSVGTTVGGKLVSHARLGEDCWPPFDQKHDTEFRKHCCEWLKEISAECGSSFPQVVGSLFLSPGGPKFIHLMYHFARYVAIKYIKTKSYDSQRFAETFNVKSQDMHKCIARSHVARNRFLQILQREHYVTQKYQENAHLCVKQVRNLRSECMVLQNQIKRLDPCDDQSNIQEKIQKVRSLWTSVNEIPVFLEKEKEVVSSVFSHVTQYALDGTNVAVNIPRLLLDRIEEQICQLQMGNVYEAGKLNLLTIIQLLNEVLKVMKCEHCKAGQARLTIDLQYLEKETKFQRERLSDMKHMRHKLKENVTAIRHSTVEKEGKWHKKWEGFLGLSPFSLVKGGASAVDLLPPMSPLSFDPVSEEVYAKSVLLKYPASLPDTHKEHNQENGSGRETDTPGGVCDLANSPATFPLQCPSSSDTNSFTLLEKDPDMRILKEKTMMTSRKVPDPDMEDSPLSDTAKNIQSSGFRGSLPVTKSDPFQKEQDHLVEEVARVVLSDSPQLSEGKEVKLEELIDTLISNPFLTRKQIPRTPENLITEVRSSWRKADTGANRSSDAILVDAGGRDMSPGSSPALHSQRDLSMAIFSSDFDQSYLPEQKAVPDQLKSVPQKPLTTQIGEPPTEDESDLINEKMLCEQDLECATTRLSDTGQMEAFSRAMGSGIDVMGRSEEDSVQVSDHSQASCSEPSTRKTLLWDSFQRLSGIGILHETLPEEVGHLSLNSSTSSETSFRLEPNIYVHSDAFPGDAGKRQATAEVDSSSKAIFSSLETLKKSLNKIRKESHLSHSKTLEKHNLELSPIAKDMQADDPHTVLGTQDLFIDYTKPSSHISLDERTQSVSPLTKVSLLEQKLRTVLPCSLREFLPNLKEEEISNKSLEARESLI